MIIVEPNHLVAGAVLVSIVVLAALLAGLSARRWGWKGWPSLLLIAPLTPIVLSASVGLVVYVNSVYRDDAGAFAVQIGRLIYILGVPSVLVGFGLGLLSRRPRQAVH